jgi:ABC-type lipoprotein release transport system permease subunit
MASDDHRGASGHVRIRFYPSPSRSARWRHSGTALGVGSAVGISQLMGWPTLVSPNSIIIPIVFSAAIGFSSSYYPRTRQRVDPIQALRYE